MSKIPEICIKNMFTQTYHQLPSLIEIGCIDNCSRHGSMGDIDSETQILKEFLILNFTFSLPFRININVIENNNGQNSNNSIDHTLS